MLRVTIELVPKGDEQRCRHLGTVEIANDGTGDAATGNYAVRLAKFGHPQATWMKGAVRGFDRIRRGPYDLLLQCMMATVGPRSGVHLTQAMREEFDSDPCISRGI